MNKVQTKELCRATERVIVALPCASDNGEMDIAVHVIQALLDLNVGLATPASVIRRMTKFAQEAERVDATR